LCAWFVSSCVHKQLLGVCVKNDNYFVLVAIAGKSCGVNAVAANSFVSSMDSAIVDARLSTTDCSLLDDNIPNSIRYNAWQGNCFVSDTFVVVVLCVCLVFDLLLPLIVPYYIQARKDAQSNYEFVHAHATAATMFLVGANHF
jgi:hypothetical protein